MNQIHFFSALLIFLMVWISGSTLAQPSVVVNDRVDFGEVFTDQLRTVNTAVWNWGDQTLIIEEVLVGGDYFQWQLLTTEVQPHFSSTLSIQFSATQTGSFSDTLTIVTNDPDNPEVSIILTAEVILAPPIFFSGIVEEYDIQLYWGLNAFEGDWLGYDNVDNLAYLLLHPQSSLLCAAKWPASSLTEYTGSVITKLGYIPVSPNVEYELFVFEGENAENILYQQVQNPELFEIYNEVHLIEGIPIEEGKTYWFAVQATTFEDEEAALSLNLGSSPEGLGDFILNGLEFFNLSEFGFDATWNIRAFVEAPNGELELTKPSATSREPAGEEYLFSSELVLPRWSYPFEIRESLGRSSTPQFLGYNLYRNGSQLNSNPLMITQFRDEDLEAGFYEYVLTRVYDLGESRPKALSFQVGAPLLSFSPDQIVDSLEFGVDYVYEATFFNTGHQPLEFSLTNQLPTWMSLSQEEGVIAPGDSTLVTIEFNSALLPAGENNFFLTFGTNNVQNPLKTLRLIFFNEAVSSLELQGGSIDFGAVPVNSEKLVTYEIVNTGNVRTFFYSLNIDDNNNFRGNFSQWLLDPGESANLLVYFNPTEDKTYDTKARITVFNPYLYDTIEIDVTGQGVFPAPTQLSGQVVDQEVLLDWFPPGISPNELRYGSGEPSSAIVTGALFALEVGAKFTAAELLPYRGKFLSSVNLYLYSSNGEYLVRVYTDENATEPEAEILVDNPQVNAWNEIELPDPISLADLDYLWMTYEIFPEEEYFPIATDLGPGISGKGDKVRIEGSDWQNLGDFNFSFNWIITGGLSDSQTADSGGTSGILDGESNAGTRSSPGLLGYDIFRNGNQLNTETIQETNFTDSEVVEGSVYNYEVVAVYVGGISTPVTVEVEIPFNFTLPDGWEINATSAMHHIHLPEGLQQPDVELQKGDLIGLFYEYEGREICAGVLYWDGKHRVVSAFGNDPMTPEKDGFEPGENLQWKVWKQNSQTTADLIAIYDPAMPHHDGKYRNMGLSMLMGLQSASVNTGDEIVKPIAIYPNPARDHFFVENANPNTRIRIFDMSGRLVSEILADTNPIRIDRLAAGAYTIEIVDLNKVFRERLIFQ